MKDKVSCIIPAHNEGPRISKVLKAVNKHPLIDEIIVVNDASTDNTDNQAKKFKKIKLISLAKNMGKTKAVSIGLKASKNKIVFLLDADLVGLKNKDVTELIKPILDKEADVTISLRAGGLNIYKYIGIDFISGERVFYKDLINQKKIGKLKKYGLESYMNEEIIKKKKRLKIVRWNGVKMTFKSQKIGFFRGSLAEISMIYQIVKTIGIIGPIRQIIKLSLLKV